jgi:hypothetical protein
MMARKNGDTTEVTLADLLRAIEASGQRTESAIERLRTDLVSALTRDRKLDARVSKLETQVAKLIAKRG